MTMDIHQRGVRPDTDPLFIPSSVQPSSEKGPSVTTQITELPTPPQKPTKRSFDVAFLMAPDDLSTKKRQQQQQQQQQHEQQQQLHQQQQHKQQQQQHQQQQQQKHRQLNQNQQHQLRLATQASLMQKGVLPDMTVASENMELKIARQLHHHRMLNSRGLFNDLHVNPTSPLGLFIPSPKDLQKSSPDSKDSVDISQDEGSLQFAKSAFTKVKSTRLDYNGPPNISASPSSVSPNISGGGLSPDASYQESLSPPMMNRGSPVNYFSTAKSLNPSMAYFAGGDKNLPPAHPAQFPYTHQPKDKVEVTNSSPSEQNGFLGHLLSKGPDAMHRFRPMFCQNGTVPYGSLPVPYPFPPNFPPGGPPVPAHTLLTAAASVTAALLPPALAALTMPAQNVCAKCKISFRMTSDLVYHMRSHHKGENVPIDATRRRRDQDKLRCPVCNETFRERHHLTRHMTAHQDKEGDDDEDDALELSRRRNLLK